MMALLCDGTSRQIENMKKRIRSWVKGPKGLKHASDAVSIQYKNVHSSVRKNMNDAKKKWIGRQCCSSIESKNDYIVNSVRAKRSTNGGIKNPC